MLSDKLYRRSAAPDTPFQQLYAIADPMLLTADALSANSEATFHTHRYANLRTLFLFANDG